MIEELFKKYRPKSFKRVVGQDATLASLNSMLKKNKVPHAMLFTGPSGCGKTTLARILKEKVRCSDHDFNEMNCADFRGIDMVRDIRFMLSLAPMGGECRVYLIDECHQLTAAAQDAFLKILEDTPKHIYFFLATTHPEKLKKTIKNRCTEIKVKPIGAVALGKHLESIIKAEEKTVEEEVIEKIVSASEGSARKALVLLDKIIDMEDTEDQLELIEAGGAEKQVIEIARALLNQRTTWAGMKEILTKVDEDPEGLRWMVLGYMKSVMLKGGPATHRAAITIEAFREHFYDSKHAGLVLACYEVVTAKK